MLQMDVQTLYLLTPITQLIGLRAASGNPSLALESLSRMQGFDTSAAHNAYHDAFSSLLILRLIKFL